MYAHPPLLSFWMQTRNVSATSIVHRYVSRTPATRNRNVVAVAATAPSDLPPSLRTLLSNVECMGHMLLTGGVADTTCIAHMCRFSRKPTAAPLRSAPADYESSNVPNEQPVRVRSRRRSGQAVQSRRFLERSRRLEIGVCSEYRMRSKGAMSNHSLPIRNPNTRIWYVLFALCSRSLLWCASTAATMPYGRC